MHLSVYLSFLCWINVIPCNSNIWLWLSLPGYYIRGVSYNSSKGWSQRSNAETDSHKGPMGLQWADIWLWLSVIIPVSSVSALRVQFKNSPQFLAGSIAHVVETGLETFLFYLLKYNSNVPKLCHSTHVHFKCIWDLSFSIKNTQEHTTRKKGEMEIALASNMG
jgi:hypothetical protein